MKETILTLISHGDRRWYPGRVEISGWFVSPADSTPSLLLSRLCCLPLLHADFPSLKDDPGSLLSLRKKIGFYLKNDNLHTIKRASAF
jgi:hypothetical protein